MIVSFCPGRVRLRLKELKNKALAGEVLARIRSVPGITGTELKTLTGSLLIEYDTKVLSTKKLMALGQEAMKDFAPHGLDVP
ncbi:MAG: ATPase P [Spirochaetaceae bacterium]|jgi:hypothetical protein|nr:ATPase P [Spirochaetaceae bacterium]